MNALVKKEFRLLLPGFLAGLLMVFATCLEPLWEAPANSEKMTWPFLLYGAVLMLALATFGREFSSGTFSALLAQPVSRMRIWVIKNLMLAAMTVAVWATWFAILIFYHDTASPQASLRDAGISTILLTLAVYSGGLWSVLLFRQVTAAFWFTALPPVAIWVIIENISMNGGWHDLAGSVESAALIVYAGAGFLFAMRLFLRSQDAQWTGGHIVIGVPGLALRSAGARRSRRPRVALLVKELQFHQSQIVIAGMLVVLHLGAIAARTFGTFTMNSSLQDVLHGFWALWLLMPLLIGCAAVAEERKMATLESQLCLPVKRRTQFAVKLFVVIFLSVLLGSGAPWLLEWGHIPFWPLAGISTGIAVFAFYASTLSRHTLQALAPAVLGILVTVGLLKAAYLPGDSDYVPLWRGPLIYVIGGPMMAIVIAALAYWNYQRVSPSWSVWRKNLLALCGALALSMAATTAVYHRPWELVLPIEPAHGIERLSPGQARLWSNEESITVILPDGRAWLGHYYYDLKRWFGYNFDLHISTTGKFLEGTNWTDVVVTEDSIGAIQRDGSLWVSKNTIRAPSWELKNSSRIAGASGNSNFIEMKRVGNDSDWKSIHLYDSSNIILLKNDGTLWMWGSQYENMVWGLNGGTPQRLGTDSDWAEIIRSQGVFYFRKTNGEIWANETFNEKRAKLVLNKNLILVREREMEAYKWKGMSEGTPDNFDHFCVTLNDKGTLREIEFGKIVQRTPLGVWKFNKEDSSSNAENHLLTVVSDQWDVFSLKSDGTLWKLDFDQPSAADGMGFLQKREGRNADWVDISSGYNGFTALGGDGSLWLWQFEPKLYSRGYSLHSLLQQSRKPQYLGNIFDDAH